MQLAHTAGVEPHVHARDGRSDAELTPRHLACPASCCQSHMRSANEKRMFGSVPSSVDGGTRMSGFSLSRMIIGDNCGHPKRGRGSGLSGAPQVAGDEAQRHRSRAFGLLSHILYDWPSPNH